MAIKYSLLTLIAFNIHLLFTTKSAFADAPSCHTHPTSPSYCVYTGRVKQLYANSQNAMLLYFDTPLDLTKPAAVGITGITQANAALIYTDHAPEFAKYFYSTALAAQASGRKITVQMNRGTASSGFLEIDRIWLTE